MPPESPVRSGLQVVDYLIVFAYMTAMMGVGWHLSRKQETSEAFFVGDRKMPWFLTGLSMIATLMSTLTYLGMPGEIIKNGIAQGIAILAAPFAFVIVGYLWVPFFMRLKLTSAYEYLELRFGTVARMFGVTVYLYMRFVWMGAIIFTASSAIAQMTQDSAPQAISTMTGGAVNFTETGWFFFVMISTGVVSTLYTMLGGIRAVILTDALQFFVLFGGAVMTLIVVATRTGTGPAAWWAETTSVAHQLPAWASWDLTLGRAIVWSLVSGFFWHICTHASDQVALQRYFTTRDARAARKTAAVNYLMDALMAVLLAFVGMALLTYYLRFTNELPPGITDPRSAEFADKIFPRFIVYGLPIGVSGFVLAAVFAVAQSSIDSGINSTATVISVDLVRRFRSRPLDPHQEMRLAQALTLAIGIFVTATGVAIHFLKDNSNILEMQFRSFNCVLGPLGAVFMSGILLRHVGQRAVVIAGCLGAATGMTMAHMQFVWDVPGPSVYLIIPLSWLVTFVSAALLGSLLPPPRPEQVRGLTWQSVMFDKDRVADE